MNARLVHEVDNHLHLVIALEVRELGRIASLSQGLKASLHKLNEAAAKDSLLAEEVFLGLLRESRLNDAGTGTADAPAIGHGDIPRIASSVLSDACEVRHARALGELTAHNVARALGSTHDDVNVLGSLDVAIVDIEAMRESERIASMQVRGNVLLVNLGLQLVGNKNHDDVSFLGSLVLEHDLQASFFSLSPALGAFAQANANVDARVHEVERMGMALRAITNNRNLLTLDDFGVHVIFVIDSNSHGFLLFFDCIQLDHPIELLACGNTHVLKQS